MHIAYVRVSKSDDTQVLDLQTDAMQALGIPPSNTYQDKISGKKDKRPGLEACLKALRPGDTLVVWSLDRLGRDLVHLVNTVEGLNEKGVSLKVLSGQGLGIDTSTASGKLVFGIFAALAEFERELIRERTLAGMRAARARGKKGGRRHKMTKSQVRLARASMGIKETNVSELCRELGVSRQTLYRYVDPKGGLRAYGKQVLGEA